MSSRSGWRKKAVVSVALIALAGAGAALADVTVNGDSSGSLTLTAGQPFVVAFNDSYAGALHTVPGSIALYADPCVGPGTYDWTLAKGRFAVDALGPNSGGQYGGTLTVSCSGSAWSYSGNVTLTIGPEATWTSVGISGYVVEDVPANGSGG